jgi:hypothetical protein
MTDVANENEYDTGPELLQVEESPGVFECQLPDQPDGKRYLSFGGTWLPSLPHVIFGLCLKPETTQEETQAVADLINQHCDAMYGMFFNRSLTDEYPELNEHGLAKLESCEDTEASNRLASSGLLRDGPL